MWYRVFGSSEAEPSPAALAEHLHARGLPVEPHFKGDDLGWTGGQLRRPGSEPVMLARYLTKEDDLRDDLNAYAAELELVEGNPHATRLMERVIQARQVIALAGPGDPAMGRVLDEAVRFLASATAGVYQIDGRGWFDAGGELLVPETEASR